ncbi:MAG TPA: hypothetical protein VL242_10750 [Sorangium sp.]|nr:hypothetical protein [Sorangium sp.]
MRQESAPGLQTQLGPPLPSRKKLRAGSLLPWLLATAGWLLPALAGAQPAAGHEMSSEPTAKPAEAAS